MIPFSFYIIVFTFMAAAQTVVNSDAGEKLKRTMLEFFVAYLGVFVYLMLLVWRIHLTIYGTLYMSVTILLIFEIFVLMSDIDSTDEIADKL